MSLYKRDMRLAHGRNMFYMCSKRKRHVIDHASLACKMRVMHEGEIENRMTCVASM